jgi:hypothetical protein
MRWLTSDEVEDLLALHSTGVMINDLATVFGISRTTVMGHLDRAGVERRSRVIDRHLTEAAELYGRGWSLARIGKHFGVDAGEGVAAFRRTGVHTRRWAGA